MSEKPVVFISHATSTDKHLAEVLKNQLEYSLSSIKPEIFVSSTPEAIDIGTRWFDTVIEKLKTAKALILLITPQSVERHWVWFELGFFWSQAREHIYPLYVPTVKSIPHPLSEIQAKSLSNLNELEVFLNKLHNQFGIIPENAGAFYIDEIIAAANEYLGQGSQNQPSIDIGSREGYSDEALAEMITEYIEQQRLRYGHSLRVRDLIGNFEPNLFTGALIDFNKLDIDLQIPPGASKRLLKLVAARQGLIPKVETENNIRFEYKSEFDKTIQEQG